MDEILGPDKVNVNQVTNYMFTNGSYMGYNWTIEHGEIIDGQGTPVVNVKWNIQGTWHIYVQVEETAVVSHDYEKIVVVDPNPGGGDK